MVQPQQAPVVQTVHTVLQTKYSTMKNNGFTLIELLLFIVLSTTMIGFGIAGYRDFSVRQIVDAETRTVASNLRYAQSEASNGVKPVGCVTLDGYRVAFVTSNGNVTSYTISAVCGANTYLVKTVTPDTNVRYTVTGAATILFRTVAQGTNLANPVTINVIGNTTVSQRTLSIVVSPSGDIR